MADIRTNAYSLTIDGSTKAKLSNVIAGVIDNYEKKTISYLLKNKVGTPMGAGSMTFKRFKNSASAAYGTARTARAGTKLTVPEIVVNLSNKKEIIEEVNKFDLETFGIAGVAERRVANYQASLRRELERAFFAEAKAKGMLTSGITATAVDIEGSIESKIQELETTSNNYVDGIERDQMALVLKPSLFGLLKNKLNDTANTAVSVEGEMIPAFNGVATFSSTYLPADVDGIVMAIGAIGQPVSVDEYALEKINLSNDWALQLYYDYGIKSLADDLIFVSIPSMVTVSTAGAPTKTVLSTTTIDLAQAVANGYTIKYYAAAAAGYTPLVAGASAASATAYTLGTEVVITATFKVQLLVVNSAGNVVVPGTAVVAVLGA